MMTGGIMTVFALIFGFIMGVAVKSVDLHTLYGVEKPVKIEHKVEADEKVQKALDSGKYKHVKTWKIYKKTR